MSAPTAKRAFSPHRLRLVLRGLVFGGVGVFLGVAAFVATPLPRDVLDLDTSPRILARDGSDLAEGRARDGSRRYRLDNNSPVPERAAAAFVAVEDQRFGQHPGIDLRGIFRAVRDSVRAGRIVSGASTINQQLARLLGKRGPGLSGKVNEALWALRLTAHLDDAAILRAYLDRVPLGRNAVGVEAGASIYYGVPAHRLSWAQAALLAGLAHAPAREDPFRHPEAATDRRSHALNRIRQMALIDDDELRRALVEPLPSRATPMPELLAPHLTARLRAEARDGGESLIETTIDATLQRDLEDLIADEVRRGPHLAHGLKHAGIIVVDNRSREILARLGSADYFDVVDLGQNDATIAKRQPGSTLKPFFYARAFELGLTAATILRDVATAMPIDDDAVYTPQNYDRRQHGPVPMRVALQNSYNVPAVEVARRVGPADALQVLRNAGFASLDQSAGHYGVGLVLGNGEVSLEELATAYVGLANGGLSAPLKQVKRRLDVAGNVLWEEAGEAAPPTRFLSEAAVALVTDILRDDPARAPAFGHDNALDLPFDVAAKTGTSRSYVDNWTAGFTAERTVVVWAGSFDGTPMRGVSGVSGAGVLFRRVMERAMKGIRPAPLVDERRFVHADVCPQSGLLAGPRCPHLDEVFLPGSVPTEPCPVHVDHLGSVPGAGAGIIEGGANCAPGEVPEQHAGAILSWAQREGRCAVAAPSTATRLLSPRHGEVYVRDPGLPNESQPVPLRLQGAGTVRVDGVDLDVDVDVDVDVGVDRGTRFLTLEKGPHRIEVLVNGAVVDQASFTIR